jgi:hypothetical protein
VVVLGSDSSAKAFIDDCLDELAPEECEAIAIDNARTCVALLGIPVPRRLLIVDGAPPDMGAASLYEAVRLIDRELPILLVRYRWEGPAWEGDRVYVRPGPLVSRVGLCEVARLLATGPA